MDSSDIEDVPLLAEVPPGSSRRGRVHAGAGVQTVRSAVLGITQLGGPTTIGFTGLATSDEASATWCSRSPAASPGWVAACW